MMEWSEKVAVITGAARGIGHGIAQRCVEEGMRVVIADIDDAALASTGRALQEAGGEVLAVTADVARFGEMQRLARQALDAFGAVHLLCNNAGLSTYQRSWEMSVKDWNWVLGVNLYGVIHGLKAFLPTMLAQQTEAWIVNTASEAGLIGGRRKMAGYYASKAAVIALTESVYHELAELHADVHIAVYIPGLVRSDAWDPERYRPAWAAADSGSPGDGHDRYDTFKTKARQMFNSPLAMDPSEAVNILFAGLQEDRFYIRTHPGTKEAIIRARVEDMLQGRNPLDRIPAYRTSLLEDAQGH